MRKKIIAGNWKMNKNMLEGKQLINDILQLHRQKIPKHTHNNLHIVIAPPFYLLPSCVELVNNYPQIFVGAQNCFSEESGAYTGEVSASMLKSAGVSYVIIGHSERRQYFNETNEMLAKKVALALKNDLTPIFCCGEKLEERQKNNHFAIVKKQLSESLFQLNNNEFKKTAIAYEPVWAIGTGLNATPAQTQEMHSYIRNLIKEKYDETLAQEISILYGGSCNAKNAAELFANPDVDGGLIGGASLKAEDFSAIIHSI